MIELKNVTKVYKSKKSSSTVALDNINLNFDNKGMVFIVGKSGSGKSTLLNLLGGLDIFTSGEILINGKNISSFNQDQFDSYRNTYIGFIFQEFNVLEQYNVYENIELSLRLQNQKVLKSDIDKLLHKLELDGLGTRKINELSGGQKQRVAIARALIKNPKIILADEPTGNLDKKSSEQIFNILKEISKNQLVIVVSHDISSAEKYASRIIEIEDGKIIKDSNSKITKTEEENLDLKKSKLPVFYALKMAITSFKRKPVKLFMTVLLTAISLIFMGLTVNCVLFDKTMLIVNTMQDNENYVYDIFNSRLGSDDSISPLEFNDNDLTNISTITSSLLNPSYLLYDNNQLLHFEFGENDMTSNYYRRISGSFQFIEVKDERILGNLIGRAPQKNNEVVVHKYFADYAIKFGIQDVHGQLYFPSSYLELVSSNKEIKLGDNSVIITGIIDDDDNLFTSAKESGVFKDEELEIYFNDNYVNKASYIYVRDFVDHALLRNDEEVMLDYVIIYNQDGSKSLYGLDTKFSFLQEDVNIITKDGIRNINELKEGEVILSSTSLQKFDDSFDSEFNNYLLEHSSNTYEESLNEFVKLYLSNHKQELYLSIYLQDFSIENKPVEVIGISLDDNNYISHHYTDNYHPISKKLYSLRIFDDRMNSLYQSFNNLVYNDYLSNSKLSPGRYYSYDVLVDPSNKLIDVIAYYEALDILFLILSIVFCLFTLLLFSNFISVSISYCKKEIGILRALGASRRDIIKIFGYESLIIGILSWVLAVVGWFVVCNILNKELFSNLYYTLNGIVTHPLVPIIMLLYTLAIALLITSLSITRITKIKPIDAILNK